MGSDEERPCLCRVASIRAARISNGTQKDARASCRYRVVVPLRLSIPKMLTSARCVAYWPGDSSGPRGDINQHVARHLREFVTRRARAGGRKNRAYDASSNDVLSEGRAPIHEEPLEKIEKLLC